jgi:hypothetical protein
MKVKIEQIDRFILIPENDADIAILNYFYLEGNAERYTMSIESSTHEEIRKYEIAYNEKKISEIPALSFQMRKETVQKKAPK